MNQTMLHAVQGFLEKSGRSLRVKYRNAQWVVDVDGLPGTEMREPDLGQAVVLCVLGFVVTDWKPGQP